MVIADNLMELGPFAVAQEGLEVSDDVVYHADVLSSGRIHLERVHEQDSIPGCQLGRSIALRVGDQAPKLLVMRPAVREEEQLVDGVEVDDRATGHPAAHQILPAVIAEHAFDEILTQDGVCQSSFLFDRNERKVLCEGSCEKTDPVSTGSAMRVVETHSLHANSRRASIAVNATSFRPALVSSPITSSTLSSRARILVASARRPLTRTTARPAQRSSQTARPSWALKRLNSTAWPATCPM